MRPQSIFIGFLIFTCSLGSLSAADDARLKETLRTLTLRLRSAETERNTLLGDKAQFEQEKKTLTDKVDALTKQAAADKAQIDTLTTKAGDQEKELADTKESLAKWKSAFEELQASAKKVDAERAKFADQSIILKRTVADREAKNHELVQARERNSDALRKIQPRRSADRERTVYSPDASEIGKPGPGLRR